MNKAKASLTRNEESFRRLCKIQQLLFFKKQQMQSLLTGSLIVLLSLAIPNSTASLIVLFLGCWFIAGAETPPMNKARSMAKQLNPKAKTLRYSFDESSFRVADGLSETRHEYHSIDFIVDDARYIYLFRKDQAGFMVDKSTISGVTAKELADLLERECRAKRCTMNDLRSLKYALNALKS